MKHLKYFESETLKYYWSVPNDRYYVKAAFQKIGASKYTIDSFLEDIHKMNSSILYISKNSNVCSLSIDKDSFNDGYKYMGDMFFTDEEIDAIEIEKNIKKYNI